MHTIVKSHFSFWRQPQCYILKKGFNNTKSFLPAAQRHRISLQNLSLQTDLVQQQYVHQYLESSQAGVWRDNLHTLLICGWKIKPGGQELRDVSDSEPARPAETWLNGHAPLQEGPWAFVSCVSGTGDRSFQRGRLPSKVRRLQTLRQVAELLKALGGWKRLHTQRSKCPKAAVLFSFLND